MLICEHVLPRIMFQLLHLFSIEIYHYCKYSSSRVSDRFNRENETLGYILHDDTLLKTSGKLVLEMV